MPTINKGKERRTVQKGNHYNAERRAVYNSERWKRLRAWKFANDPLCEMCLQEGKVVPAEDIHHVVSFMSTDNPEQRMFLAYDYDNLMSLCKVHHQELHNKK